MIKSKGFLKLFIFGSIILVLAIFNTEGEDFAFSQQAPVQKASETETKNSDLQEGDEASADSAQEEDDRISLDLKGIDITEVFRLLSLKTGTTIVPTKNVKGRISIFLNNVTFQDALDVILISQGLAAEQRGNILMIMTNTEYNALYGKPYDEKRQVRTFKLRYAKPASVFNVLDKIKSGVGKIIVDEASGTLILIDIPSKLLLMTQAINDLDSPLETEIFDLQYADSSEIKSHLGDVITSGTGELFVDERTSKLIVSDLPERMNKIKKMVKTFDEEDRQVFIEAEIVQVTLRDEYQRGINWQEVFSEDWSSGLKFEGTFPVTSSFTASPAIPSTVGTDPSGKTAFRMNIGTLADDKYDATMDILETFGDTKILSRPKIAVLNNEEAKILVGTREAYITQTLSQGETTTVQSENIEFIDVGVKLNVLPTINKEGFVTMKIKPEVSSVLRTVDTDLGSVVPIVETSEAETVVKVKTGTIIMIAGLLKDEKRNDVTGIPILSKIPVIGALFGSRADQTLRTELIVFLKPRIITGEKALAGTEIEKMMHPELMPEDMRKEIIKKEIENIKVMSEEEEAKTAIEKIEEEIIARKEKQKEKQLEGELKGFKDF